jgi:two-component sensor histidine kinase
MNHTRQVQHHWHHFTKPATPASVPAARLRARKALADFGVAPEHPTAATALLVLTELATNCVTHAADRSPYFDVGIALDAGSLVIAVHDRHPYRPRPLPQPYPEGGGWGLKMVADLAASTGGTTQVPADPDGCGKTVRVRLPLSPARPR